MELDIEDFLGRLGLRKHPNRSRSNGLYSMIKRIGTLAQDHAA